MKKELSVFIPTPPKLPSHLHVTPYTPLGPTPVTSAVTLNGAKQSLTKLS